MKKTIPALLLLLMLSACNGWIIQPIPGPTPFLPATPTPLIYSPTPVVIGVTPASATPVIMPSATNAVVVIFTETATLSASPTFTPSPADPAIAIKVLGCNTSIDVLHGMGEVTNAYVTLSNTGGVNLTNLRITLFALDEGREHPDKTIEMTTLPIGFQVTMKLTVDSTYRQETPIQVEVTTTEGVFPREGLASCTDIGLFAPDVSALNTPVPVVP